MSRYFFDVVIADRSVRDEIGLDLPAADEVWPEIARLVHDHLLASPPDVRRVFDVTVRGEGGAVIVRNTTIPPAVR